MMLNQKEISHLKENEKNCYLILILDMETY